MNSIAKVTIGLLILIPISIVLTIFMSPIWRWFEMVTGIESIGHSGPAIWCYIFTCALIGTLSWPFFSKR